MRTSATITAAALVLSMLAGYAIASDQDRARELARSGTIVPLERITEQVRMRNIEHILEVELESDEQGHFYEVEVIDNAGVVHKLRYDAVTGELISEAVDED